MTWKRIPLLLAAVLPPFAEVIRASEPELAARLIGYTELRADLPGGRQANVRTMRAAVVKADGAGRRLLGEDLAREPDTRPCGRTGRRAWGKCHESRIAWREPAESDIKSLD